MTIADMKLTAKDRSKRKKAMTSPVSMEDGPEYPYGLTITLDATTLDKLKMKDLPKVGDEFELSGDSRIVSVHQSDGKGGADRRVELQITELGLGVDDDEEDEKSIRDEVVEAARARK